MSGNAADIAQTGWIASLEVRLDTLWGMVVGYWVAVTAWIAGVYAVFVVWITPIVLWIQGVAIWLQTIYNTYVLPVLTTLQTVVFWLQNLVLLIQGKLELVINTVYNTLFPWVEDLRRRVVEIFSRIEDVADLFDVKLSDRIHQVEQDFLRNLDKYTRDVRDFLLDYVHKYTDPVISKLNSIDIVLRGYITQVDNAFAKIDNFLGVTFERPQLLRRQTIFTTSQRWGVDLWNDLFSGITPTKPVTPSLETLRLEVDPVIDRYIDDIFLEKVEGWQDIARRMDEEIKERYYGEVILLKTKIEVPKLPRQEIIQTGWGER